MIFLYISIPGIFTLFKTKSAKIRLIRVNPRSILHFFGHRICIIPGCLFSG